MDFKDLFLALLAIAVTGLGAWLRKIDVTKDRHSEMLANVATSLAILKETSLPRQEHNDICQDNWAEIRVMIHRMEVAQERRDEMATRHRHDLKAAQNDILRQIALIEAKR